MDLSWLADHIPEQPANVSERLLSAINVSEQMVKTVRRIATELRPDILDRLGLSAALEWLLLDFNQRSGVQTHVEITSEEDMQIFDGDQATALFRVVQEALTNVARYAEPENIYLHSDIVDDELVLELSDDGRGFDVEGQMHQNSLGLFGMRERLRQCDGKLQIKSEPGEGTTVVMTMPVVQSAERDDEPDAP